MQRVNPSMIYGVGKHLSPLEGLAPGVRVGDIGRALMQASIMLSLCRDSSDVGNAPPLHSCLQKARVLEDRLEQLRKGSPDYTLDGFEVEFIRGSLHRFEGALQAELADSPMFYVPPRGIYNTAALIDKAETVFSQPILDRLPEDCIADLRQAGRALAFDLPTASGFHGCRATEAVIKKQVLLFSGAAAPTSNWGDFVRLLKLHGADGRVSDSIHRMKEVHRNPLIHPEITLTMPEAITLLSVCHSTIQACVADMERKSATPSSEILDMLPPPEPAAGGVS